METTNRRTPAPPRAAGHDTPVPAVGRDTPTPHAAGRETPPLHAAGDRGAHDVHAAGDQGSPSPHAATADQGAPAPNATNNGLRRDRPVGFNHGDEVTISNPPTRLTGQEWTLHLQCIEAPEPKDYVEFDCDRADITFYNLIFIKSKLGYSGRDYMYYKKRCGRDTASLISIDYDHQIQAMIANNERERQVRMVLTRDQHTDLLVSITPMKRARGRNTEEPIDGPGTEEPIDAYKDWLAALQQDQPDTEFKDDYRDETIKTYKEWLRRQDYLQDIISYLDQDDNDVENLLDDEGLASRQSAPTDWPSHARRKKKARNGDSGEGRNKGGHGALKGLSTATKRIKSGSQKLKVEFSTRLGGPIGPNNRSFVDEVVMFTRKRAPLIGVKKWKDIEQNVKNSIASDILNRWELLNVDDEKEKIWAIVKERYKGWRSTFSATYKAYNSYAARMKHKLEDIDIAEWHYLMLYFGSPDFKKASNRNSNNRKEQKTKHIMGSKPFPKLALSRETRIQEKNQVI